METLAEQMMDQMRADLVKSGDYESYGEEGIRIAVYEDLKDTLKHIFYYDFESYFLTYQLTHLYSYS